LLLFQLSSQLTIILVYGADSLADSIGVGDVPPQKKIEKKLVFGQFLSKIRTFSGKNRVKFGNFVNFSEKRYKNFGYFANFLGKNYVEFGHFLIFFSYIFFVQKCRAP